MQDQLAVTDLALIVIVRPVGEARLPEIFNTDQGSQFTGEALTDVLHLLKRTLSDAYT